MEVVTVETPQLGDRSYLAHDGAVGVVIDPQRDWDRMVAEVQRAGVHVSHVLETHIHNDYVTGGWDLARYLDAEYGVAAADEVNFERLALREGQEFAAGSLRVQVAPTPGHTHHHLSYVVSDAAGPQAAFTGGSLLFGTVGRTDLVDENDTDTLTRDQYWSAQRLADQLSDSVAVYPTHGFGSFCASGASSNASHSTIGAERVGNLALTTPDEDTFVDEVLAGLSPYPAYYAYMSPINHAGGARWDVQPPRCLEPSELRKQVAAGEWVIDLRGRLAFAQAHVPGTVGIEHATQFAIYVGWLCPWHAPLTLIGADREQVEQAQRDVARIGIDDVHGASTASIETLTGGTRPGAYSATDFAGLAAQQPDDNRAVLDVRQRDEWDAGHLPDAVHIPIQEIPERRGEVPSGQVRVHSAADTVPASQPACWPAPAGTWCSSTTPGTMPSPPVCRSGARS